MDDDNDFFSGGGDAPAERTEPPAFDAGDDDFGFSGGDAPAGGDTPQEQADDDFGFEAPPPAQAEPEPAFEEEEAASPEPEPVAAAPAPVVSAPKMPEPVDDSPLQAWIKQHQTELREKSAQSEIKHKELRDEAASWIDNFYKERSVKFEKLQRLNLDNEEQFKTSRDSALTIGPTWERVCGLVDLQATIDSRDTARMKQVLLQVKGSPPAHMQSA
eukprot:CAMPEP_0114559532 /NCGR_PEP_ID=MMETSP0114-20121206/10968_1 /TAXON_ID=31324 /ORGANISM="Goniomonas sp, Strain m" /LENGTH=215 /DNA_ID=CAMNT_0001745001 /DNA_START=13 /DNA_END=660 /DNA_ORIENTATION=+